MIDNYNVVALLNEYTDTDTGLLDIIYEIENNGILKGTKI